MEQKKMYSKNSHKTAITRRKVSLPIRKHLMGQLADVTKRRLDYGCGKGYDADRLGMFKYDPHFFPDTPAGEFDYIYCGYVLNVLTRKEGQQVMDNIMSLLKKRGVAYVVVRRDIERAHFTSKGTYQRPVRLNWNCGVYPVKETSNYCVYIVSKSAEVKVR
jgi:hypothetical protein